MWEGSLGLSDADTSSGPARTVLNLAGRTIREFQDDDALRWGAAIAYYSVVSLAPLVALAVAGLGQVVKNERAERWILEQAHLLAGPQVAEVAGSIAEQAQSLEFGSVGALLTAVVLLFSATAVFVNLQRALNRIWSVEPRHGVLKGLVRSRVAAFTTVLALGGLILVTVIGGAILGWIRPLFATLEPYFPLFRAADFLSSLLLIWLVVSAVFRVLPDVEISWRDVWFGALVTAALLVVGKAVLSWFLASSVVASLYGTAGAIFLLLLWVYYSANVFFLGAEFTQVWARERGREIQPQDHAVSIRLVEQGGDHD